MPMKKNRRKSRKPRRTKRRKYMPKGKRGTFRSKVKKALFDMSETKQLGRALDWRLTLGTLNSEWAYEQKVFPDNADVNLRLPEGTGVNQRVGNRVTLMGMRIPMYILNQTAEALRVRVVIYKINANSATSSPFINPLGNAEDFNYTHPWQSDYAFNKERGTIVKERKFILGGAVDWGSTTSGPRPIQMTGQTGVKRLEMGFSFRAKKQYFDQVDDSFRNIDQYEQITFVWRLYGNDVPYLANHLNEGLGNLRIRQFHKVYFKDV